MGKDCNGTAAVVTVVVVVVLVVEIIVVLLVGSCINDISITNVIV